MILTKFDHVKQVVDFHIKSSVCRKLAFHMLSSLVVAVEWFLGPFFGCFS